MLNLRTVLSSFVFLVCFSFIADGQTCVDLGGVNPLTNTQNFDALGTSPAPQNGDAANIQVLNASAPRRYLGKFDNAVSDANATVNMPGWALVEEGTNSSSVTGRYNVGDGSSAGANTYSYGTSSDRAFGSLNDDTVAVNYLGGCYRNMTGADLTHVIVSYTGEMWRRGAAGSQTDRLDFAYAVNSTNIYDGTFTAHPTLDFVTPNTSGTAGARDGNTTPFRTVFGQTLISVAVPAGGTIYFRWIDQNIAGPDDGLAIDDFFVSFLPHTAADVSVSGRVTRANGRAAARAILTLNDGTNEARYAVTNTFGYYRFTGLTAGRSYVIAVNAKAIRFKNPSMMVEATDSLYDVNFIGIP